MARMLDTEGVEIPRECNGRMLFDADLCDFGNGKGPMLAVNVPQFFETIYGIYEGDGIVSVPIQDVLEEYLRNFAEIDGGDHIEAFADWLHDYAGRLKRSLEMIGPEPLPDFSQHPSQHPDHHRDLSWLRWFAGIAGENVDDTADEQEREESR